MAHIPICRCICCEWSVLLW